MSHSEEMECLAENGLSGANPCAGAVLDRVAEGDYGALEECFNRYRPMVRALARGHGLGEADVEDAVQDTLIEIWRSADRFDSTIANEATFIRMLAKRRIIDKCRLHSRTPRTEPLSEELCSRLPDASHTPETHFEMERIRGALSVLPPNKRRVIEMAVWQGMSHGEIAESTGMALGTVKTTIRRGLERVKEHVLG